MNKIQPIFLYPKAIDDEFCVQLGRSDQYLCTPMGNLIRSRNEALIELMVSELQKFYELELDKKNSLVGEALEKLSIYSLLCTQKDFWESEEKQISAEDMASKLKQDPITNLSPGPEQVDQLFQWRDLIKYLEHRGFDFYDIQYFNKPNRQIELAELIAQDFNNSLPYQKSLFIQMTQIGESIITSWVFVFGSLTANRFAAILSETAQFQLSVDIAPIEDGLDEQGQYPDGSTPLEFIGSSLEEETEIESVERAKKKHALMTELTEFGEVCLKFRDYNQTQSLSQIGELISRGESKRVEYKESLSLDVSKNTKEKYIEDVVIKTIAGFMNTDGGDLLIGVSDDGTIRGIDKEIDKFHKSDDRFLLHFKNIFKKKIGESFSPFLEADIKSEGDKKVFHIVCLPSDKEVFVDSVFYLRSGPSTDTLEGRDLIDYVMRRFKEKS